VPAYLQHPDTSPGHVPAAVRAVPAVQESYASPSDAVSAIESAMRYVDVGGIAARLLDELARQYPVAVRQELLRRYWRDIRPDLEAIAEPEGMVYGEFIERRMRALSAASTDVSSCNRALAASRVDIAFSHDAVRDLAGRCAQVCTAFVRSLLDAGSRALADVGRWDVLARAHADLSRALSDATGETSGIGRRHVTGWAGVYSGLAELLKDARRSAEGHEGGGVGLCAIYGGCAALTRSIGIEPPLPGLQGRTVTGAVHRMCDAKWWRRQLRTVYGRTAESALRQIGMVSKFAGLYVSDPTAERYEGQRLRGAEYLRSMLLVNELGEILPLEQVHDASVSNPELRRLELMTRMAGTERYALACGHAVIVAHLTLPSRFHRVHERSGDFNQRFDGSDVRTGAEQLQASWASVRKALGRRRVVFYGYRCVEAHHDGTVHWHMMICCEAGRAQDVRSEIKRWFLDELEPDEPGAQKHRVEFTDIDPARGSAVGYLSKYISKNIDGHGVGPDLEDPAGREASVTCHRVVAHARTHGLRQFQGFGLPSVSVWRELRRLRSAPGGGLDELWRAASEDHDFGAYIRLMGGAGGRSVDRPLSLDRKRARQVGAYGEPAGLCIRGLRFANITFVTRLHDWRLIASRLPTPTWTRGNNCPDGFTLTEIDEPADGSRLVENQTGPPLPASWNVSRTA
jgi:hypothetical protein